MKSGYIYKIWSKNDPEMVYYGSTQQQVCQRLTDHKHGYHQWKKNSKKYTFTSSYLIFDIGEYEYTTLEKVDFEELFELKNRERFYIENNKCVNKQIPNRTKKEYKIQYKKDNPQIEKEYYKKNQEKIKDKMYNYYYDNIEKKKEYQRNYRQNNLQLVREKDKIYQQKNKEKISQKNKIKVNCPYCSSMITKCNLRRHIKNSCKKAT